MITADSQGAKYIAAYVKSLFTAVVEFLEYQSIAADPVESKSVGFMSMAEPPRPEIWDCIRRNRLFGVQYIEGAWHDWPYIYTLELEAALEAEQEIISRKLLMSAPPNEGEHDGVEA